MVAFSSYPLDARTTCIAISSHQSADQLRDLGAPVALLETHQGIGIWRQERNGPALLQVVNAENVDGFLDQHRNELSPTALYRAKTQSIFDSSYQLTFVDAGYFPVVEAELGQHLARLLERTLSQIRSVDSALAPQRAFARLRVAFRLIAARILHDKGVHGFEDISDPRRALRQVARHYGSPIAIDGSLFEIQQHLDDAAGLIQHSPHLGQVTTEALAFVYENSLVSTETRRILGVHSTPSYLVDYIFNKLRHIVEDLPLESRTVLEPACGHGAFLLGAARLLRELGGATATHAYLRQNLIGIELDEMAFEISKLSLTLADIPNGDGWQIIHGDMFVGDRLEDLARGSNILVANPPFERLGQSSTTKASEVIRRTLPYLRTNAAFGIVVPLSFLDSPADRATRKLVAQHFDITDVTQLPDGVFEFADVETGVIIGRRESSSGVVSFTRVYERDLDDFKARKLPSETPRSLEQTDPAISLKWSSLSTIWRRGRFEPLSAIASVGKGLEFKGNQSGMVSPTPSPGLLPGFVKWKKGQQINTEPPKAWLRLDSDTVRRPGKGLDREAQVILNYAPVSRGPWRINALLDREGHAFTSRFVCVRPTQWHSLSVLWCILNGPLANAFMFERCSKRDNLKLHVNNIPIPAMTREDVRHMEQLAYAYCMSPTPASLADVDSYVLGLYRLDAIERRKLLALFSGYDRPGLPFAFRAFPGVEPAVAPTTDRLLANDRWLLEFAGEFASHWVALDAGSVVAAGKTLAKLKERLARQGKTIEQVFIAKMGAQFAAS